MTGTGGKAANAFTLTEANQALEALFAQWVRDLGLTITALDGGKAELRMPGDQRVCRDGAIVAGQALATMADTAMVFAVWSARGEQVPVTTVDLHVTYLRPMPQGEVIADAEVVRSGRTLAFCRVSMRSAANGAVAATAIGTFAML